MLTLPRERTWSLERITAKTTIARWFRTNYPRIKPSTVNAQLILQTTNNRTNGATSEMREWHYLARFNLISAEPPADPPGLRNVKSSPEIAIFRF